MFIDCYEEEMKVNNVEIQFLEESNKKKKDTSVYYLLN